MLKGRDLSRKPDRQALLRSVGYGIPNLEKALKSAQNSLTLISEQKIVPFKLDGSKVNFNEFHLYNLPWPKDILLSNLSDKDVKIIVTLSYFIEPNPGNKQYSSDVYYQSHELDFKLIKRNEDLKNIDIDVEI